MTRAARLARRFCANDPVLPGGSGAPAQDGPGPRPPGRELACGVVDLWQPRAYQGVVGGAPDLARCGAVPGNGFLTPNPPFSLFLGANSRGMALNIRVEAPCDTVTLVAAGRAGPGDFPADTNGSLNPALRIPGAPDGLCATWVGSFAGPSCTASLIPPVN